MRKTAIVSPLDGRNRAIMADHRAGMLQYKIAEKYGISRSRVAQFVTREYLWEKRHVDLRRVFEEATEFDDLPIDLVPTTVRVFNCLKFKGCRTIGEALQLDDMDLIAMPNFGRKSLQDWKDSVEQLRREFAEKGSGGREAHLA